MTIFGVKILVVSMVYDFSDCVCSDCLVSSYEFFNGEKLLIGALALPCCIDVWNECL